MTDRIHATVDPSGCRVDAVTPTGQPIAIDGDPPEGRDSAAGPKETLLAALAGCAAADVASILRKKRQVAATYEIEVSGESATDHPRVYTRIVIEHRVTGEVEVEALRRSVELSATKYCPISAMLSATVTIDHRYRLERADGSVDEGLVATTGPSGPRLP
jgi:putative redox protein